MLDTSILVELLRGRADSLLSQLDREAGNLCVSMITVMELDYGVERSNQSKNMRHDVDDLLSLLQVKDFDRPAAMHTGSIRRTLADRGESIGPYDSLIAGHARSQGCTIVTSNLREFARVPALTSVDWLATSET